MGPISLEIRPEPNFLSLADQEKSPRKCLSQEKYLLNVLFAIPVPGFMGCAKRSDSEFLGKSNGATETHVAYNMNPSVNKSHSWYCISSCIY